MFGLIGGQGILSGVWRLRGQVSVYGTVQQWLRFRRIPDAGPSGRRS
ncbi:MAG: hypothetical protein ACI9MC_002056 [Kiritimatiellia bacterium]|jgi:hypothetical protein